MEIQIRAARNREHANLACRNQYMMIVVSRSIPRKRHLYHFSTSWLLQNIVLIKHVMKANLVQLSLWPGVIPPASLWD